MLPKKNRVSKKTVEDIFKKGKFINSPLLSFRFIFKNTDFPTQISFIAPKSIAKLAIKRNLLRRRGYTALSPYINGLPLGLQGVFVFKKLTDSVKEIENEIKKIFSKIN